MSQKLTLQESTKTLLRLETAQNEINIIIIIINIMASETYVNFEQMAKNIHKFFG